MHQAPHRAHPHTHNPRPAEVCDHTLVLDALGAYFFSFYDCVSPPSLSMENQKTLKGFIKPLPPGRRGLCAALGAPPPSKEEKKGEERRKERQACGLVNFPPSR